MLTGHFPVADPTLNDDPVDGRSQCVGLQTFVGFYLSEYVATLDPIAQIDLHLADHARETGADPGNLLRCRGQAAVGGEAALDGTRPGCGRCDTRFLGDSRGDPGATFVGFPVPAVVLAVHGEGHFHVEGVGFGHHAIPQPVVPLVGEVECVHLPAQAGELDIEVNIIGNGAASLGDPGPVFRGNALLKDLQFDGGVILLQQYAAVRPPGLCLRFVLLFLGGL